MSRKGQVGQVLHELDIVGFNLSYLKMNFLIWVLVGLGLPRVEEVYLSVWIGVCVTRIGTLSHLIVWFVIFIV